MNSKKAEVSSKNLAAFFRKLGECIRSDEIRSQTRKFPNAFVRVFKFPWFDVLYYFIFRHASCTQSEISAFYADIGKPKLRISKQAVFKAVNKVRPEVFCVLIRKFAELFYRSPLVKKYKGYVLLAADGTTNEFVASDDSLDLFGFSSNQYVKTAESALKATSKSEALYDVTNGLVVDFSMNQFKDSEIPIVIKMLQRSHDLFAKLKTIFLADRYYPSVELFALLESIGFKYCIRGKSNFFKKQIQQMKSDDEWIVITLNNAWLKRLKYDWARKRFTENPVIRIRVVRQKYTYIDQNEKNCSAELIYFTNLSEKEFSKQELVVLYSKRWDLEVTYKTLKTDQEWEHYFSEVCDVERCCIYSKILFHNIVGVVRKEMNQYLETDDTGKPCTYSYVVNIAQLDNMMREYGILRYLRSGNTNAIVNLLDLIYEQRHKIKVPVRPNRHNQRWGRPVTTNSPMRFRVDGRNWPKVTISNGCLRTVRP